MLFHTIAFTLAKTGCYVGQGGGQVGGWGPEMANISPYPSDCQWVSSDLCQLFSCCVWAAFRGGSIGHKLPMADAAPSGFQCASHLCFAQILPGCMSHVLLSYTFWNLEHFYLAPSLECSSRCSLLWVQRVENRNKSHLHEKSCVPSTYCCAVMHPY